LEAIFAVPIALAVVMAVAALVLRRKKRVPVEVVINPRAQQPSRIRGIVELLLNPPKTPGC
jgi:hypothetical protein